MDRGISRALEMGLVVTIRVCGNLWWVLSPWGVSQCV